MQIFGGGDELAKKKDVINPNLLKGTANWDSQSWSSYWNNKKSGSKDYLGNDQIQINTAWAGPVHTINVKSGDSITISGIFKLNIDACQIGIPAGDTKYNDTAVVVTRSPQIFVDGQSRGTGYINITDQNYHVLSATYTVTQGGTLNPRFESPSDQPNFLLSSMKAEYGSVATAWCPAYADYAMNNGLMKLFDLSKNGVPNPDNLANKNFDLNSKWYGMKFAQDDVPINGKENWSLYFDFELDGFNRIQLNISVNSNIYIRSFSGSNIWSDWKQIGK